MENQAATDRSATRVRLEELRNARLQHCSAGAERCHSHLIYYDVSSRNIPRLVGVCHCRCMPTGSCCVVLVTLASTTRLTKRGFTLRTTSNTWRPPGLLQIRLQRQLLCTLQRPTVAMPAGATWSTLQKSAIIVIPIKLLPAKKTIGDWF